MRTFALQEVDLYFGAQFPSDTTPYVDIAIPGLYDDIVIVIPYPKMRDNSRALFAIYSPAVIPLWKQLIRRIIESPFLVKICRFGS